MTKSEARNIGTDHGTGFGNGLDEQSLLQPWDVAVDGIRQAAHEAAVTRAGFRSVDSPPAVEYIAAFRSAATKRFEARRESIPAFKAARRAEHIARAIGNMISDGDAELADFAKRLAENPVYAFESADRAIVVAARKEAGLHLQQVLNHEKGRPRGRGRVRYQPGHPGRPMAEPFDQRDVKFCQRVQNCRLRRIRRAIPGADRRALEWNRPSEMGLFSSPIFARGISILSTQVGR
jgi:hypothetical protein